MLELYECASRAGVDGEPGEHRGHERLCPGGCAGPWLTIDVTHPKQRRFCPANTRSVEHHKHCAMHGVRSRFDQTGDFLWAQHPRQFLGFFGVNPIIEGQIASLQDFLVEKTQRRHD